jgi:hypothetical protein
MGKSGNFPILNLRLTKKIRRKLRIVICETAVSMLLSKQKSQKKCSNDAVQKHLRNISDWQA